MFSTGTGKQANTLNKAKINLTDDTLKNILIMAPMLDEIGQNRVFGLMCGLLQNTVPQQDCMQQSKQETS